MILFYVCFTFVIAFAYYISGTYCRVLKNNEHEKKKNVVFHLERYIYFAFSWPID